MSSGGPHGDGIPQFRDSRPSEARTRRPTGRARRRTQARTRSPAMRTCG
jgi:hypothetical protein